MLMRANVRVRARGCSCSAVQREAARLGGASCLGAHGQELCAAMSLQLLALLYAVRSVLRLQMSLGGR